MIAGIICCILIITIPFGIASFRMANYALWPFGRTMVKEPDAGVASAIGNVIWFIFAGWWLALGHLVTAIAQFVTIIGIPLGIANLKLIPVSLMPLGRRIVDSDSSMRPTPPVTARYRRVSASRRAFVVGCRRRQPWQGGPRWESSCSFRSRTASARSGWNVRR